MSATIPPEPSNALDPRAQSAEVLVPGAAAGGALGPPGRKLSRPRIDQPGWRVLRRGPGRLLFDRLFLLTVFIPTLLSIVYFGFIASDVFISESRFVVRMPQRTQQPGVIGALLQGSGFQRAQDDSFTVHDFILSRDALRELDARRALSAAFSRPEVDALSRFPLPWSEGSFEDLYKYYRNRVTVDYDATSSITTLTVRAFNSTDAHSINAALLALGETLINQINDRGRLDLVRYAAADVAEAESRAKAAASALAGFRNRREVFDPEKQSALQLQQVTKLQDELVIARLQLAQLRAVSPANPQIDPLERRARELEREMARQMSGVAGDARGNSLTDKAGEFERLQLERTFADRQVASAMTNLETARSEARRKQVYLERVVMPNRPDEALEPRRARAIIATLVVGLLMWGVLSMLVAGVREHRD